MPMRALALVSKCDAVGEKAQRLQSNEQVVDAAKHASGQFAALVGLALWVNEPTVALPHEPGG